MLVCVEQERELKEAESAADRRAAARKVAGAVTGAKAAVWGTVEGVSVLFVFWCCW